jgi:DNA-binding Xre family transcriptional regulator
MFKLRIRAIMQEKGILRPYNQLIKLGIGRNTASKMLNGTAQSISMPHLHKLCLYLNCTPKELIVLQTQTAGNNYENTPLKDWVEQPSLIIADEIAQLTPSQMEAMKTFLESLKSDNNL